MMKGQEPRGLKQHLAHVAEECAEVIIAIGKCQRWGLKSVNPFLLKAQEELEAVLLTEDHKELSALVERMHPGETNKEWLLREMHDVDLAIGRLRAILDPNGDILNPDVCNDPDCKEHWPDYPDPEKND